ncbi:MAG: transcriptional repressor [Chloroflexi bacterium]|nr:transcriptional repressor [Chloroflexota bacterium]
MSGHDAAVSRLRAQGYRMTPQRLSVLDIVARRTGHIGADEVWNLAREEHPYVDLATIYRTLQWLKGLGVVTEVIIGNKLHFEMSDHHNPHNHMVCSICDGVQTLTPDYLAEFSQRLEQEFGFSPNLDNITIGGVCNQCRAVT